MSIATIVLRGYGTSSYADVHKLPTLGCDIGAAILVKPITFITIARNAPTRKLRFDAPTRLTSVNLPNRRPEYDTERR
jgi:hypothetical protein